MPGIGASDQCEKASLWTRLAPLPVRVDGVSFERLSAARPYVGERVTTHVHLIGAGLDGVGEDVSPLGDDSNALHISAPEFRLAGEWTLSSLSEHLNHVNQWSSPPKWTAARYWRRWAFESAALDLALRQARATLFEVLGACPGPVRFVNSLALGDRPSLDPILARLERYPNLRFKVDVTPAWTPDLITQLSVLDKVEILDFKGRYARAKEDRATIRQLYERVTEALPNVLIEDPHDDSDVISMLQERRCRVSYDARISTFDDLKQVPIHPTAVNIKPCRFGTLRGLCDFYASCQKHDDLLLYGGGMDEIGVGRVQVQLLAAVFHPLSPNDVAPSGYNAPELGEGLPPSPLNVTAELAGFRGAVAEAH